LPSHVFTLHAGTRVFTPSPFPTAQVTALEIAEHIPKKFEQRFLKHITCMASRALVLSWAHPGQPGFGHINLATLEQVHEKMRQLGWAAHPEWSEELRRSAQFEWFKNNAAVFVPVEAKSALPSPRAGAADTPSQPATIPPQVRASLAQAMAAVTELNVTSSADKGFLASRAVELLRGMQAELAKLPV
jgi:hypothetical protein